MSRWIDNSLADKLYMVNHVSDAKNIDPESVEKDSKLYHEIVEHRQKYYHVGGVDYALDLPKQIVFCPTGEVRERLALTTRTCVRVLSMVRLWHLTL